MVVADSDVDAGKRTATALADWGYSPVLVHDGVEAILTIQRQLPRAVVLDAATHQDVRVPGVRADEAQ